MIVVFAHLDHFSCVRSNEQNKRSWWCLFFDQVAFTKKLINWVFFERLGGVLGLIRIDSMRGAVSVVLKIGVKEITSR